MELLVSVLYNFVEGRKKHNKIVSATREKQQQQLVTSRKTNQEKRGVSQELSTADDWKDFKMLTSSNQSMLLNRHDTVLQIYRVPLQLLKERINLIFIIHPAIITPRKGRYM